MDDRARSDLVKAAFVLLLIVGLALLVMPLAPVLLLVFAAAVIASLLRTIADPLASRDRRRCHQTRRWLSA